MTKKYTRDTRNTLKAWIQKASETQVQEDSKSPAKKAPKAQACDAREASKAKAKKALKAAKAQTRDARGAGGAPNASVAPKAQTADARYSYFDCLCDKALAPTEVNGSTLYQLLMVGCMVLFVFTANGVGHSGASFFAQSR